MRTARIATPPWSSPPRKRGSTVLNTLEVFTESEPRERTRSWFAEDRKVPVDALEVAQVKLEKMDLRGVRGAGTIRKVV